MINSMFWCSAGFHELLDLLDAKITAIDQLIEASSDPCTTDGLCDSGEYFIGVGFVVIQQRMIESIMFSSLSKFDAYKLGPMHSFGISCMRLINSCANWWKHEPEKYKKLPVELFEEIRNVVGPSGFDYPLSNVLASFCPGNDLGFKHVIPILEEWQEQVCDCFPPVG